MPLVPAKLVTVVSTFEARDRITEALASFGASDMSISTVEGHGVHGHRRDSLTDAANVAFSIVVSAPLATKILEWVERDLSLRHPVMAWAADVMALPGAHFA